MTDNPKDYSDLPNSPRLMTADLACRYVGWSRNGFAGILAAGLTAIACGVHAGDAEQAGAPVITGGKAESGLASEASEGSSRIELVGDENYSSVLRGPEIYVLAGHGAPGDNAFVAVAPQVFARHGPAGDLVGQGVRRILPTLPSLAVEVT